MRTLLHSNSVWSGTGYGQQTAQLTQRLKANGHEPAVSCFYGLQGGIINNDGVTLFPAGFDLYGNDVLVPHSTSHFGEPRGGLVITLVDVWVLSPDVLRQLYVAAWTPIDHEPAPPKVIEHLRNSGVWPVAMSRFGQRMIEAHDLEAFYAPHGIDTSVFRPRDKSECKAELGIPDTFVVGMVAANKGYPSRKSYSQAIEAFAAFNRKHPDSLLYLHTEPNGIVDGHPIVAQLEAAGIPGKAIMACDPYTQLVGQSQEFVAKLHSSFDVLLNPSMGEGFGIPIVEAQACGVPVIVTDCTAMTELCGAGWLVTGDRTFTNQRSYWVSPHISSIVEALEDAHDADYSLADKAREFALQYDADTVYREHWQPILAELGKRMEPLEIAA